jgi:PASTA domain-containing protein/glucodextranase-like protein
VRLSLRLAPLCFATLGAAVITACGGDPRPAPPPVRLTVSAPRDLAVVHDERVEVTGSVRPSSATVIVEGRRATVAEGAFHATVSLAEGTNVVDVLASAGRARPALAAIRVRRDVRVAVPDLVGTSADDARTQLTALGLKADVQRDDGIFDRLLPGAPQVCATDPESGTEVEPDTTVRLLVARNC